MTNSMTQNQTDHELYMQAALSAAHGALQQDEVPIGAVLVDVTTGEIVARGYNTTRADCDPTCHAEIAVIRARCQELGAQRIPNHILYVTLEPCPMCAAAISYARIDKVVFGAADPKSGGLLQGPSLYAHPQLHHKPNVVSGICADECSALLSGFFAAKRSREKNT